MDKQIDSIATPLSQLHQEVSVSCAYSCGVNFNPL